MAKYFMNFAELDRLTVSNDHYERFGDIERQAYKQMAKAQAKAKRQRVNAKAQRLAV